jgi:hypothetical protein
MAGAAATLGLTCEIPPPWPPVPSRERIQGMPHLAWAWHFGADGSPETMASVLAQSKLGLILKTHNGTSWMSKWDTSPYAITGPEQIAVLVDYFEGYGVPFHTYCVPQGLDPQREAEMCAEVIGAGARSIFLDLEPFAGYWQGTPDGASYFAQEFRRRQPAGTLYLCVDPRPWVINRIPMAELVPYSQGLAPMVYWESFNTSDNIRGFQSSGYPPGEDGITPEFLLDVSRSVLQGYGLPIMPVGQGNSTYDAWVRFMARAQELDMVPISVWRYGVTNPSVWDLLKYIGPPSGVAGGEPGELKVGGSAKVANTGSCLNARSSPGTSAMLVACLADGTIVKVLDGPEEASKLRWWLVQAEGAVRGWVAEGDASGVKWLVPVS